MIARHVVDFHVAAADVDERADDRAHHVTQETGAADLESQQPAVAVAAQPASSGDSAIG